MSPTLRRCAAPLRFVARNTVSMVSMVSVVSVVSTMRNVGST